jgi:hypothetical protein
MGDIKVKSFRATWSDWDISWRWTQGGKSTVRLPVSFRLELEQGSSKNDCMVGQFKRGLMSDADSTDKFPNWTIDGPVGDAYWWNGDSMSTAGFGEWDGLVATFKDKPGFNGAKGALLMASCEGDAGYFEWSTKVVARNGYTVLAEILWWMRIDVPNPGSGGHWWSYSNQK